MDYQDHTQDKIITRYNSFIKAKQAHDYNHFKEAILHKGKQSVYMPCQYNLNPWLELPPSEMPLGLQYILISFTSTSLNQIAINQQLTPKIDSQPYL